MEVTRRTRGSLTGPTESVTIGSVDILSLRHQNTRYYDIIRGQMRTDRFFFTGALGGLAVGGLLGPGLLTGALLGGAAACVGAGLTNPMVLQDT